MRGLWNICEFSLTSVWHAYIFALRVKDIFSQKAHPFIKSKCWFASAPCPGRVYLFILKNSKLWLLLFFFVVFFPVSWIHPQPIYLNKLHQALNVVGPHIYTWPGTNWGLALLSNKVPFHKKKTWVEDLLHSILSFIFLLSFARAVGLSS